MTTSSSSDTLSTMCSSFEPIPDMYKQQAMPMMKPLIPPNRVKTEQSSQQVINSDNISAKKRGDNGDAPSSPGSVSSASSSGRTGKIKTKRTRSSPAKEKSKQDSIMANPVAYSFNIPKGLFNGFSLMFLFGVCAKWYMTLQHRKITR
eukprot:CAMPEP_0114423446 /NCGR_PEP_ID=MMETSP0103-20121206/6151_1 /TAXON_ID=37642 ORGANISM="Paraphysomonas imperforata, Strain PA2" /NCGR_SAMPLE_ID=MMETSP0103 /ASSEMBLY_ACC=CAM_ASM_000201 /LENGTH=147 /DNA_ID=CAMNT_0001592105 /DNA_START=298 /DNA_END=741 /DNA_ORIENTATION=+